MYLTTWTRRNWFIIQMKSSHSSHTVAKPVNGSIRHMVDLQECGSEIPSFDQNSSASTNHCKTWGWPGWVIRWRAALTHLGYQPIRLTIDSTWFGKTFALRHLRARFTESTRIKWPLIPLQMPGASRSNLRLSIPMIIRLDWPRTNVFPSFILACSDCFESLPAMQ